MHASNNNLDAYIEPKRAIAVTDVTAAGTGDATEIVGVTIDRMASGGLLMAALLFVQVRCNLTASKTCSLVGTLEHSPDDSAWASAPAALQPSGVAGGAILTALAATGDQHGTGKLDIPLRGLDRYIRIKMTPDLSAGSTDTARISATFIMGGAQVPPA
jgi:hypothetical protein